MTQANTQKPDWPRLIFEARERLGETQEEFGKRFGVVASAVSLWENGLREAPYEVTWWLHNGGTK